MEQGTGRGDTGPPTRCRRVRRDAGVRRTSTAPSLDGVDLVQQPRPRRRRGADRDGGCPRGTGRSGPCFVLRRACPNAASVCRSFSRSETSTLICPSWVGRDGRVGSPPRTTTLRRTTKRTLRMRCAPVGCSRTSTPNPSPNHNPNRAGDERHLSLLGFRTMEAKKKWTTSYRTRPRRISKARCRSDKAGRACLPATAALWLRVHATGAVHTHTHAHTRTHTSLPFASCRRCDRARVLSGEPNLHSVSRQRPCHAGDVEVVAIAWG